MFDKKMSPILKWAGGKSQILEYIADSMPADFNNYYEPFIGGASVLLGISPAQAYVNDINEQLVNLYTQLKLAADSVIKKVNELDTVLAQKNYTIQFENSITQRFYIVTAMLILLHL